MMNRRFLYLSGLIPGLLLIALIGCAGMPLTRFFVMSSMPDSENMANRENGPCFALGIGPVKIPEYLNRPEVVTRLTANEVRVDDFAEWAEPLEANISRVLAGNLPSLLCTRAVALFPWKAQMPIDYRIEVQVIQMDGVLGERALLDVSWSIADGADRREPPLLTKRSSYEEPADGKSHGSFVSAQSRNLARLSRDIAEAILGLPR